MVYGYDVKVINLIDMEKSHHYNPFHYIRKEQDVVKLITNFMANTTPKDAATVRTEGMMKAGMIAVPLCTDYIKKSVLNFHRLRPHRGSTVLKMQ